MSTVVRVGFASGVRHAIPYGEILAADDRVRIIGVAEEADAPQWMRDDSQRAAQAIGTRYTEDLDALIAACDIVIVCTEPTRHTRVAARVLRAGINVVVDKPVGTNLQEVDELVQVAQVAPGYATVINRLASPAIRRLRRWVDAGHLGLPLHVDAEFFASGAHFATSVERPELVVDPSLSGGGEVLNFLLYPVDYIRYLTGLEVTQIHCEAATLFSELHRANQVEDCAVASLLLENGVTATVTVGRIPAAPGLGPVCATVRLLGSHGHASSDDDRPQINRFGLDGRMDAIAVGGPSSVQILGVFFDELISAHQTGRRPSYTLADARSGLAVVDSAYRSVQSGQPVSLTDSPICQSNKES